MLSFLKSVQPEWSKEIEADVDFANEWRSLINNKSIVLDGNKIRLNKCNTINDSDLLNTIQIWNHAIEMGLLGIDPNTMEFYMPTLTEEVLDNVYDFSSCTSSLTDPHEITSRALHGCGNSVWNVGILASNNYATIVEYYNSMVYASIISTGLNPWLVTVTYWVALVRENGAWDYKSHTDRMGKTYCCIYGGLSNQDHYVEWIGNYNYGYTGSFLFTLNVLHTGSLVVAGFDSKDEITDWPAIDEGYEDALELEWN